MACDLIDRIMEALCPSHVRVVFQVTIGEQSGPVAKTPQFLGPPPHRRHLVMLHTITDSQRLTLTPKFLTKKGNIAPIENPVWSADNTEVVALELGTVGEDKKFTPDPAGLSCRVSAMGPLGVANVTLKGDSDIGDGEKPIFGTASVQVGPGEAVSIELMASPPEEIDAPPAPPAEEAPPAPPADATTNPAGTGEI
jgi:hypothetical protein